MKELTNEIPKPMLRVQGKPILEHIIAGLKSAGVCDIFIVTGFRADVVEEYFGDGSPYGVRIQYGRQLVQDGTGKAPELARGFVGPSPFILTYGDILVKPDTYKLMIKRFNEDYFSGVVTVTASDDISKGGLLFFDEKFCLTHVVEKPTPKQVEELKAHGWLKAGDKVWYNAGIYIFRPSLFEFTTKLTKSARGEFELTDAIAALIAAHHPLAGLRIEGRWVDVRDPDILATLQRQSLAD